MTRWFQRLWRWPRRETAPAPVPVPVLGPAAARTARLTLESLTGPVLTEVHALIEDAARNGESSLIYRVEGDGAEPLANALCSVLSSPSEGYLCRGRRVDSTGIYEIRIAWVAYLDAKRG